jgi:hypothetical protein
MLYHSALVMYDRQTQSLWSHFTAQGIMGTSPVKSSTSTPLTSSPGATGATPPRRAGAEPRHRIRPGLRPQPYPGYDDIDSPAFLFEGEVDGRLAAKELVVGIERGGDAVAVRTRELAGAGVLELEVGGDRLVVWLHTGTASALDAGSVAGGRKVGSTGVFVPVADREELTFARTDDAFVDDQTASRWNVLGQAIDGPLADAALESVIHVDTFWFAWGLPAGTQIVP